LIDYRAVIIDLAASPLTAADRRLLAEKIRGIHAAAYQWDPRSIVTDGWLDAIVTEYEKHQTERGGLRPLCRAIANALDLAEQHKQQLKDPDVANLVSGAFREDSSP
jgi:hypothetical protein